MKRAGAELVVRITNALTSTVPWFADQDTCIGSTRIAIDVYKHYGVKAEPLPVRCDILNPTMVRKLAETGGELPEDVNVATAWGEEGAWIVSIGGRPPAEATDGYNRHMVVLVERTLMIDLTIMQATRLHKSVDIQTPLVGKVTKAWLQRRAPIIAIDNVNGCMVTYKHQDNDPQRWRTSPGWNCPDGRAKLVGWLIDHIEKGSACTA